MKKIESSKKGFFFSMDALIALIIILLTILIVYPIIKNSRKSSSLEEDVMIVLSSLKVKDINDSYVNYLISVGIINDLNNSILEQIGELYVTNKSIAENLTKTILTYFDTKENIGIWYGDDLLGSTNSSPIETAENIETVRQVLSGISNIESNGTVTGYSARAWLSGIMASKYFYFGGYIGDGNITVLLNYDGNLTEMDLEIAINNNFSICINGNNCSGHFEPSASEFEPKRFNLSAYSSQFVSGINKIKFKPVKDDVRLYIAGGYVKVAYESAEEYYQSTRYYFPGIEGLINIYDGFYVPGTLNTLEVFLHMNTSYETFLTIGNKTVFNGSTSDEENITIPDSNLSSLLDYLELSQETTPFRLGLENVTYVTFVSQAADVISVTDLSGSMCDCTVSWFGWCKWDQSRCEGTCGGTCVGGIHEAKDANKDFIDIILNGSGNREGLVGYEDDVQDADCHDLSNDSTSLKSKVDDWVAEGSTCICCGINEASDRMVAQSNSSRYRVMVVMSDGLANRKCDGRQGTGDPINDAIQAACDAFQDEGIIVHAVGFGPSTDEDTLKNISACGNGSYYYGNISNISIVYQQIAEDIIDASEEQTIESTSDVITVIYPDSYIEFNYTKVDIPYGLITTIEKQFYNNYTGNFSLPSSAQILEAVALSYSGPRWTDYVGINNSAFNIVYNLSDYGSDYTKLGDPYSVNIPNSFVEENNEITITTGVSPANSTQGSEFNKIIYTIRQNASSFSEVVAFAVGCIWHLDFEDGSSFNVSIPEYYTGSDHCYYQPTGQNISSENDAVQLAVFDLLNLLDIDANGKIDVEFIKQDLKISSSEITGIPYVISTEAEVRRWW